MTTGRRLELPTTERFRDGVRTGQRAKALSRGRDMEANNAFADAEARRDHLVRMTGSHQLKDLALALSKGHWPGP